MRGLPTLWQSPEAGFAPCSSQFARAELRVPFRQMAKDGRQTDDIDRSVRVLSCSQEVVVTGLAEGIDTGRDQDYRFAPGHRSHLPQGEDNSVV